MFALDFNNASYPAGFLEAKGQGVREIQLSPGMACHKSDASKELDQKRPAVC
jgi:hypothetical protein